MMMLRQMGIDDEDDAMQAHAEMASDDFVFLLDRERVESFESYLELLERQRQGVDERPDRVPAAFLVADVDGELVGRSSIRYELNDFLRREGGHIGFGVRPTFRRRGYATRILELSLAHLEDRGVTRALVTCDDDNIGSRTVIERCGGRLEDKVRRDDGVSMRRYWINSDARSGA